MPDTRLAEQLTADRRHWDARALAHLDGNSEATGEELQNGCDWLVLEMCVKYGRSFLGMTSEERRLFTAMAVNTLAGALSALEYQQAKSDECLVVIGVEDFDA